MTKRFLRLLGFRRGKHSLPTEIYAGFSTFIVMAYVLALAPACFANVGGEADPFPVDALFTATALVSAAGTLLMAFYARKPLALAPGVGLLFFISGSMCGTMGYSWHFALTAVFIEGVIFTILTCTGMRTLIVECIPLSLRSAIGVGVSFFLASLGLKNAGITDAGSAISSIASIVTEPEKQLLALCVMIAGILIICKVRGAIFYSLIVSSLVGIPMGLTHIADLTPLPDSPMPLFCEMEWSSEILSVDMVVCVISILFLDMFDTIGTVLGVLGNMESAVRMNGRISGMSRILQVDAISSLLSGIFGTTTSTTYLESAAGVAEGGRTGVTSFVTGMCFLAALFLSPLFLAIPTSVTGGILLVVSVQMFSAIRHINFSAPVEAIPSVMTILFMALLGSISDGIVVGVLTYAIFSFVSDMRKEHRRRKRGKVFE